MTAQQRSIAIRYKALSDYIEAMKNSQAQFTHEQEVLRQEAMDEITTCMAQLEMEYDSVPPPPPDPDDF
jgi:hypothetical protein